MPPAPVTSPALDLAEVARSEEARQSRGVAAIADVAEPIAGGFMCFAGVGSWANQAMGLGMTGPVDLPEVDRLIAFYTSRGVEPRIEVCPLADATLVEALADRQFVVRSFENVLVFDLQEQLIPDAPAGVDVRPLDRADEAQVRTYIDVVVAGFRVPDPRTFERVERRTLLAARTTPFLAYVDGRPAAAGNAECAPPAACLFGMTTLEQFRGRGCQQALMVARLRAARDANCRYACVYTDPRIATGRNALRLGFRVAYTKAILVRPSPGLVPSP